MQVYFSDEQIFVKLLQGIVKVLQVMVGANGLEPPPSASRD